MFSSKSKLFLFFTITAGTCSVVFLLVWRWLGAPEKKAVIEPSHGLAAAFLANNLNNALASASEFSQQIVSEIEQTVLENRILPDLSVMRSQLLAEQKDFIEVDLEKMKVAVCQQGQIEKELPILAKGAPERWGGAPAGLYQITSSSKSSYSSGVSLYMPWALRFYGKYYVHGEPYYQDGKKHQSPFTGGCLRLADSDAEFLYNLAELKMPVLVIDKANDSYFYPLVLTDDLPNITAENYLVADLNSGFVLLAKNPDEPWPIASLTKWMTAVALTEQIGFTRKIWVSQNMLDLGYSSTDCLEMCAEVGQPLSMIELLYPMLIQSSNDAAYVLSSFFGVNRTVEMMNQKAKSILMSNTHFIDPSGYDPGNISTAQDLYYLARYIYNVRPTLLEIGKGKEFGSFPLLACKVKDLWNKNIFINDDSFVGAKTGYITASGYNGVFIFNFTPAPKPEQASLKKMPQASSSGLVRGQADKQDQERPIAIILLGSQSLEQRKRDVQRIYIWLQKTYFLD